MDLQVMTILATLLLLALTTTAAEICDVYNSSDSATIKRCALVQDCISKAFQSDRGNLFIIDRVFHSTKKRSPVAVIINYHVTSTINDRNSSNNTSANDGEGSGSVIDDELMIETQQVNGSNATSDDDGSGKYKTKVKRFGWSASGIHKVIRPEFLAALRPPVYQDILQISIENKGIPKSVYLWLNISNTTECELLRSISPHELNKALEHLTEKINYKTPGKVWNTDMNSLQSGEIWLLALLGCIGLMILIATPILIIATGLHNQLSDKWWHIVISLVLTILTTILDYSLLNIINLYTTHKLSVIHNVIMAIPLMSCLCGFILGLTQLKSWTCTCSILPFKLGLVSYLASQLVIFSIPLLIEMLIYPTEVIFTIGYIVIATTILIITNSSTKLFYKHLSESHYKFFKPVLTYYVIQTFFLVIIIIYGSLGLFSILLPQRLESSTNQPVETVLAFLPTIFAVLASFYLNRKFGSKSGARDESETNSTPSNQNADNEEQVSADADSNRSTNEEDNTDAESNGSTNEVQVNIDATNDQIDHTEDQDEIEVPNGHANVPHGDSINEDGQCDDSPDAQNNLQGIHDNSMVADQPQQDEDHGQHSATAYVQQEESSEESDSQELQQVIVHQLNTHDGEQESNV